MSKRIFYFDQEQLKKTKRILLVSSNLQKIHNTYIMGMTECVEGYSGDTEKRTGICM